MIINDVFYSIQGEGIYTGRPTAFVRLQGCNLACSYCDTKYSQGETDDKTASLGISDVQALIGNYPTRFVCITGGEPLMQAAELEGLVERLGRYCITVETNGSLPPPPWAGQIESWCVDVKTPSSGNPVFNDEWLRLVDPDYDRLKFVVQDKEDLEFVSRFQAQHTHVKTALLISPMIADEPNRAWLQEVAQYCLKQDIQMGYQLHKIIWPSAMRGV